MAKAVIDIAMSLDGYVAGPNDSSEHGLGENGGERIMGWDPTDRPLRIAGERGEIGAMISGRRTYDITNGWNGTHDLGQGIPVFVVTEAAPDQVPEGTTPFTFVTDGTESAVRQAKAAAGDKMVYVIGGANVIQQLLNERLADELSIHIAPVFVGDGVRLFKDLDPEIQMKQISAHAYAGVTNIVYDLQA
jgi:dihydrofolate reductase